MVLGQHVLPDDFMPSHVTSQNRKEMQARDFSPSCLRGRLPTVKVRGIYGEPFGLKSLHWVLKVANQVVPHRPVLENHRRPLEKVAALEVGYRWTVAAAVSIVS